MKSYNCIIFQEPQVEERGIPGEERDLTVAGRLDRILNTAPLRENRPFRLFWMGTTAQSFARQLSVVAVMLQIWDITRDALWLGIAGLVSAAPMVVFGMIGGWLADHFDRRIVTMWTTVGALACSALLVLQAWLSLNSILVLLLIIVAQLSFTSAGSPARRSILPRVLTEQQLGAGIALTHVSFQAAMLAGPALGGALVLWGALPVPTSPRRRVLRLRSWESRRSPGFPLRRPGAA